VRALRGGALRQRLLFVIQAAGFGRDAARLNAHYSQRSGFKVNSHLSDRYAPFYAELIAATSSEALHVLDALLYQSDVATRPHHTDGGGDSDHVFALCSLLGFQFAPPESRTSSTAGSTASASRPSIPRWNR
jgi:TnpA family transposase